MLQLGVGSFVFARGLVSQPRSSARRETAQGVHRVARFIVPQLVLGLVGCARFITTTAIDYQEHVTE